MKKNFLVVLLVLLFAFLPALSEEQKTQQTGGKSGSDEVVTKTYALRYVTPKFINDSLRVYLRNCSYGEGSNLISVIVYKKDIATFEEQLRKLDIEKKIIRLRIFTVIASKEGKSDAIENKDLKRVLAEVSNLLNFKSYVLDGASVITLEDGARFGRLLLSSATIENLGLDFERVSISTGSEGKRSVKLGLELLRREANANIILLNSETEIAENGYLLAGVSRIGNDGRSLVLVINAEIK
jgi:hypothetical protein